MISLKPCWINIVSIFVAISVTILVYMPGLSGDFVHDDIPNIIQNEKLHITTLDFNTLLTASFSSDSGPLKRPISMFSLALNHYFHQLEPFGYKLFNICIHLIVGVLLFYLTILLLDSYEKANKTKPVFINKHLLALFVITAWLASPINLTGVLYIVQRMTSLSALFTIAVLCCYVRVRRSMIFDKNVDYMSLIMCTPFLILAMYCKENAVLSFFYIICIEFCFFNYISNKIVSSAVFKKIFIFSAALPILAIIVFIAYEPGYITGGYNHRSFSLTERLMTESRIIFHYLKWIIIPNISELGLYHDDIRISKSILEPITTIISIAALLSLFLAALVIRKKIPLLAFSIFFFLSSHLLESTIIPLEIVYEHRNYLASYGIIFGIFSSIFYLVNSKSNLKLAIFVSLAWLIAISVTTNLRANHWKNDISLSYYEAQHHPTSARATFALARTYANLTLFDLANEKEKAISLLEKSTKLMPNEIIGEASSIIFTSLVNEDYDEKWVSSIEIKLKTLPITHITINSLSELNKCILSNCNLSIDKMNALYMAALENNTQYSNKSRSELLTLYAKFSADVVGNLDLANSAMKQAIQYSPNNLQFKVNYVTLLIAMGKYEDAKNLIQYIEINDKLNFHKKGIANLKIRLNSKAN